MTNLQRQENNRCALDRRRWCVWGPMTSIADSSAVRGTRVLPQHQAALTLIQSQLSVPSVETFRWLDLACGRGQIIQGLEKNLSSAARSRIQFYAYDINETYGRETRQVAEGLSFKGVTLEIGELSKFDRIVDDDARFDFISLTNTVHEIEPKVLSRIFIDCLRRLSPQGTLFIYDMEQIAPPELGAVPWNQADMREVIFELLDSIGSVTYRPEVGQWQHTTCNGWNVQIDREHIKSTDDALEAATPKAVEAAGRKIRLLLEAKRDRCSKSLEALALYGARTAAEEKDKERLLYEFWSVIRALGADQ